MTESEGRGTMASITPDKWLNFAIEHYDEYQEIRKIMTAAEKELPAIVDGAISDAILNLQSSYFAQVVMKCEIEDRETSWAVQSHYKDTGFYFTFEGGTDWQSLTSPGRGKSPALGAYLGENGARYKNKKERESALAVFRDAMRDAESDLQKSRIEALPWDDDDPRYLVGYWLSEEVQLASLRDDKKFRSSIQQAVQEFTDAVWAVAKNVH
jgi:hypothetical protein